MSEGLSDVICVFPPQAGEGSGVLPVRQGLPAQLLGPVPLPVSMESKVSSSQQALLQHLLQKEQLRQQKIFSTGENLSVALSILSRTLTP